LLDTPNCKGNGNENAIESVIKVSEAKIEENETSRVVDDSLV
jgi:hypothetical protein